MASRDAEVRAVVSRLDALLGALAANVDALTAILVPGGDAPPADAKEAAAP
jgi:hypothetical protein